MKQVVTPALVVFLLLGTLQAPVAASRHLLGTSPPPPVKAPAKQQPAPGQKQQPNESAAKQQITTARTAPAGANPNSATTGHGARSEGILQVTPSSRVELAGIASGQRNLLQSTVTPPVKAPASQPAAPGQKQPNETAAKQQPQAAKGRTAPAGAKPTSPTTGHGARTEGILQVSAASRLELAGGASGQRNLLQNPATPPVVKAPASQPAPAPGQKQPEAAKQQPQAAKGRTAPAGQKPAGSTATGQAARNSDVAGNRLQINNDPDAPLDLGGAKNGGRAPSLFGRHRRLLATSPPVQAPGTQTVAPGQKQPNEAAAKQQPQAAKGRTAPAGQKPAGTAATGQAARNVITLSEPISISQAKP